VLACEGSAPKRNEEELQNATRIDLNATPQPQIQEQASPDMLPSSHVWDADNLRPTLTFDLSGTLLT
jgi:hypothetical protein